ncbi:MAG: DUF3037 domain-containing protein [Sphingobacteriales bacterium]|nr:MAG: DUF3037 domain-containing protein [Sphingobacteriales bacterium]
MHDCHLYEYGVIRIVPRVEREEFINAGVIVFCKRQRFIQCLYELNIPKIQALDPKANLGLIEQNLAAFAAIAHGSRDSQSPIARLDVPERFRWLTATRSTIIQTGKIHAGLAASTTDTTLRLFDQLVR